VDYLNLATAIIPEDQKKLADDFKVPLDRDGFFLEAHMKLRPVDFSTSGVFLCGLAHYPKPLEESIAQALAAAGRAANLLARDRVAVEPIVSVVDPERCIGCGLCAQICPFGAMHLNKLPGKGYRAENTPALCKGCGLCASSCPRKAVDMLHFRDRQILAAVQAGGTSALEIKQTQGTLETPGPASVSGYRVALDRYYHPGHSWVRVERGGRVRIGMDHFISRVLGPAASLRLPAPGTIVGQGRAGWLWRRNGHKAEVLAPVTGRVFALNPKVRKDPAIVHADPYGEGWLLVLEPAVLRLDMASLFTDATALQWMEDELNALFQLLGPGHERLAATGGEPVGDLFGLLPQVGWERLVRAFLRTAG
jgi:heterodisulfide reductase subunit A